MTDVSRETRARLDTYLALLAKWQAKINLVASDTLKDAEVRHIQDSLQLLPHIVGARTLVDLGSGAGFPGLALALARPDLAVHLVESDAKKCTFMQAVSRETHVPVTIHTSRIEALPPFAADVITARALAPLADLLAMALPYVSINPLCQLIFLKGERWVDEVAAAQKTYHFDVQDIPSLTNPAARILIITNLRRRD
jgi:16S rRNA (guanine527-N7)-methyltransferase